MSAVRAVALGIGITLACLGARATHAAELLAGNKSADTVWRLSLRDGRRTGEYRTGEAPHEIAVAPDGRTAVVTNYGGSQSGNTLSVLDLVGGKPTRTIDLGQHSATHGIRFLPDGRRVLVTTEATASLVVVDVASGEVERTLDVGAGTGHMVALSPDGQVAYLTKIQAGTVSRIDLATGARVERAAGKGAEGVAARPDGAEVWVTNREDGTLTVHDPRTLAIRRRMSSKGFPIRVTFAADGTFAFVAHARAATLAVFNARTKVPLATVPLSREDMTYQPTMLGHAALPIGVVVAPDRPRAYVAISGGDRIAVVDTQRWQVIDYWVTGREPDALAFIPD